MAWTMVPMRRVEHLARRSSRQDFTCATEPSEAPRTKRGAHRTPPQRPGASSRHPPLTSRFTPQRQDENGSVNPSQRRRTAVWTTAVAPGRAPPPRHGGFQNRVPAPSPARTRCHLMCGDGCYQILIFVILWMGSPVMLPKCHLSTVALVAGAPSFGTYSNVTLLSPVQIRSTP